MAHGRVRGGLDVRVTPDEHATSDEAPSAPVAFADPD